MKHDQQTATRRQFIGVLSDVHIAGPKGPSPDAYRKALLKFRDAHVDGGAYLSGTGSVTTVTMDDGSGFFARVGSTGVRVTKSLTLPDSGTVNVDIANPDNLPVEELRATLVQGVQSVPADLNWNVTVDGVAAPQMKVRLAGGKLTCRYPTGLILLVR